MDDILSKISRLKQSAKTNRDFGDYQDALNDLDQAIGILDAELKVVEHQADHATYVEEVWQRKRVNELARDLADCYGMAGGIYRRVSNFDKSIEMYNLGYKYEQNERYDIQDSYNLSNSIVVPILKDPTSLDMQKVQDAVSIVQEQVRDRRRDQWWAWADLGLFYVLLSEHEKALEAYAHFKTTGARLQDYDSTITVLSELEEVLGKSYLPISSSVSKVIVYLRSNRNPA